MRTREEILVKVALAGFYDELEKVAVVDPSTGSVYSGGRGYYKAPEQVIRGRRRTPGLKTGPAKPKTHYSSGFTGGLGSAGRGAAGDLSRARTRSALSMAMRQANRPVGGASRQVASAQ